MSCFEAFEGFHNDLCTMVVGSTTSQKEKERKNDRFPVQVFDAFGISLSLMLINLLFPRNNVNIWT